PISRSGASQSICGTRVLLHLCNTTLKSKSKGQILIAFGRLDGQGNPSFNRLPTGARMKKLLLVGVAGVALVAAGAVNSADAADLARKAPPYVAPPPPPPVFSWTGCFVGAQVGWGWGRKNVNSFEVSDGVRDTFFGSGH